MSDLNQLDAVIMLADKAMVYEQKLSVLGGGWTLTSGPGIPASLVILFYVPLSTQSLTYDWRLELIDSNGHLVEDDQRQMRFEGDITFTPNEGEIKMPRASLPLVIDLPQGHPVQHGQNYEWRLWIDEETKEHWRLPFAVAAE